LKCGVSPPQTRHFSFGKRDCSKSSLAAFSLLKALNVLTVRLGLFAACGLARKLFEQSLLPKLKCPKPFPPVRGPSGPSVSVPNKIAQELAALKQPSPKRSIRDGDSAAPEGERGTKYSAIRNNNGSFGKAWRINRPLLLSPTSLIGGPGPLWLGDCFGERRESKWVASSL
jgi:hypothetical protein